MFAGTLCKKRGSTRLGKTSKRQAVQKASVTWCFGVAKAAFWRLEGSKIWSLFFVGSESDARHSSPRRKTWSALPWHGIMVFRCGEAYHGVSVW